MRKKICVVQVSSPIFSHGFENFLELFQRDFESSQAIYSVELFLFGMFSVREFTIGFGLLIRVCGS